MNNRASGPLCIGFLVALTAANVQAASPVVVDATGRVLGFYQGPTGADHVRIISTQAYVMKVAMKTGSIQDQPNNAADNNDGIDTSAVYFTGPNCTGDSYYPAGDPGPKLGGWVFWASIDASLWYVPKQPQIVQFTAMSVQPLDSGPCTNVSVFGGYIRAQRNDPAVTGFSNEPMVAPLRIEVATISNPSGLLLRDGFEPVG